jgi:UDP-N-acetylmuramoyl-tripeptide--D-alanyl-D-alanine ligase
MRALSLFVATEEHALRSKRRNLYPRSTVQLFTALLVIVASLSPLLTFAHLWQVKEWRLDRLADHLRSEGFLRQIFGVVRVPIVALCLALAAADIISVWMGTQATLWILTALTILQVQLRRQPTPIWTSKARVLVVASLAMTVVAAILLSARETPAIAALLAILPLVQPMILVLARAAFSPLDRSLKRRILRQATALRIAHPELTVIGITGSVGKTTAKELIACAIGDQGMATPAYVNTELGVAKWLIERSAISDQRSAKRRGTSASSGNARERNATRYPLSASLPQPSAEKPPPKIFIIEMGAYRRGEIALLCSIAKPQIGVLTFIGTQHIALFGSQDDLLAAKGELLAALPRDGHAFLNVDSALTASLQSTAPCPVTTVSTGGRSDLEAFDIEETARGIRFRAGNTVFSLPLHGTHNVCNVLLAIGVAEHLGVQREVIAERLTRFRPLQGTFSVEDARGVTVLNDTHNASPESASAAIQWAETQSATPKVLLLSGIIEQGQATESVHRELGVISTHVFDRAIILNKKFAQLFAQGCGKNVEILSSTTAGVSPGSLLVCIGRMPRSAIERMLPKERTFTR